MLLKGWDFSNTLNLSAICRGKINRVYLACVFDITGLYWFKYIRRKQSVGSLWSFIKYLFTSDGNKSKPCDRDAG